MQESGKELAAREYLTREEGANQYDAQYLALHGPEFVQLELRVLRQLLQLRPEDVLLDLGCGTGRLTVQLAPLCRRVIALDRSGASLGVLRDRLNSAHLHNVSLVQADVTKPLGISAMATAVLSVQLLQHLPSQSTRMAAIRNAYACLSRGGRGLFVDEAYGVPRTVRNRPRDTSRKDALFFHTFTPKEMRINLADGEFGRIRSYGLGVLYWTKYKYAPRAILQLDLALASFPGSDLFAKFLVTSASRA